MAEPAVVEAALAGALAEPLRPPLRVTPLTGGYSWSTLRVDDAAGRTVVVRVAPAGGTLEPYDPEAERRALAAARRAVPAPEVLAVAGADNPLGAAFSVQTFVPGAVLHLSQVTEAAERHAYRAAFADALGALHHGGDPRALGEAASVTEALDAELARTAGHYRRASACAHPGLEIGLRWLRAHRPDAAGPPALCHGDFRLHNLAWTAPGHLSGVLDWERAWAGDPMVDVAFTRRFSGWCAIDGDAVARYEAAARRRVDERRVAYGLRLEQLRSYTSSLRGVRALADGRSKVLALYAIGEAGDTAAWDLCAWLADGPLPPLPQEWRATPAWSPLVPPERLAALTRAAREAGDVRLAEHLDAAEQADRVAAQRSVEALRALSTPGLKAADPRVGWARAYEALTAAAATGGPELLPALDALALRSRARATLRRPVVHR